MGLFDRYRSAVPAADSSANKTALSEQEATRLIESGQVLQAQGKLDEAMQCYLDAVRIAPNPARAQLNRGNVLVLKDDLQGALEAFSTAIKHKPDYAGAYYNIGNALLGNRQFDEAVANYRRALEIQPDYAEVHCSLGVALKELGQIDDAIACFQAALEIKPDFIEAHYNFGMSLQRLGKLEDALASYRRTLELKPDFTQAGTNCSNILNSLKQVETHYNSGISQQQAGQLEGAAESYRKAIKFKPDFVEAYNNLGIALTGLGLFEQAVSCYRKLLTFKPNSAEAHFTLGLALHGLGKLEEAADSYRRTLQINPNNADAYYNLGNALKDSGQLNDAAANYRCALELEPDIAGAYNNLGNTLIELGQLKDGMDCYHRELKLNPGSADAYNNLGNAQKEAGQLNDAVASFRRALELKPDHAEAHNNLGNALLGLGQLNDAAASYRRALELSPDFSETHNNLGNTLRDIGLLNDAVSSFHRALELNPDFPEAYNNLGNTLKDIGRLESALASYRRALAIKPDYTDAHSNLLFGLNYTGDVTTSYYLEQASQYGKIVADKVTGGFSSWQCAAQSERLRVGMVSGDLCNHSVGHFLEGLLAHIDPARIELIAYSTHYREDELTSRIRPYFSAWKPLFDQNNEAAARLIHADGVHVLIDLSGHTAHNRLPVFAWKPAPVQVTWLGLPTTTGVTEIDYVLGDLQAIPREHENHFTEAVWRLPNSYVCFSAPAYPLRVAPLPALATGQVTFGSFNNLTKMTDVVVELWARILLSVPGSRLYLKTGQLKDEVIREQTRQRFAARGIAPERLLLRGMLGAINDHLAEYNHVDIALDTFPYPGVTTSVEALWMGVPVLSLQGDRFLSRTAGSIAHNAGLPDWIAADADDYVAKAVAFASDLDRLAALRANLRQQVLASPLFDAPRFARHFEDALWGMWQRHQAQQETPEGL
jgi:protein O-GlcNAc transferase